MKAILIIDIDGDIDDYVVDVYRRNRIGELKEYSFDRHLKPLPNIVETIDDLEYRLQIEYEKGCRIDEMNIRCEDSFWRGWNACINNLIEPIIGISEDE